MILHRVSCMNRGGQETLIMNLYRNIDRSKIQFSFLCTTATKGDYDDEIISLGGKLYYLPEISHSSLLGFSYIKAISVIKEWLCEHKNEFSILHLHTYHASDVLVHLEACRQAGVTKVIVHSHNTAGPHAVFHKFCRFINSFYDFNPFACGKSAGEWLFGGSMINHDRVTIIRNGIDTELFKYSSIANKNYRSLFHLHGKTVLGHVGRFEPQKNHAFLINVFEEYHKQNENSVLLLIGRGSLEDSIKTMVKEKGLDRDVWFMGVRDDIPQLLSMMDLFIFPSLYEGLSVSSIEVQCSGLPMLTSDIPSMRESKLTDTVQFVPLIEPPITWARNALSMPLNKERENCFEMVKAKGFDIKLSAKKLEEEYISYMSL